MNAFWHIRTQVFAISQGEFSKIAGVSQATVSRWEKGEFAPGFKELRRIRTEAIRRGLAWDDALFFAAPRTPDRTKRP